MTDGPEGQAPETNFKSYYFLSASPLCCARFNIRFRTESKTLFLYNKCLNIANQGSLSTEDMTRSQCAESVLLLWLNIFSCPVNANSMHTWNYIILFSWHFYQKRLTKKPVEALTPLADSGFHVYIMFAKSCYRRKSTVTIYDWNNGIALLINSSKCIICLVDSWTFGEMLFFAFFLWMWLA